MRIARLVGLVAILLLPLGATAKAPDGQGRACDAHNKCTGELQCVTTRAGKPTCELVCAANNRCPEDQRCVKDGAQKICRPITDGVGLLAPPF
jgi:hypothetical protein